MPLQLSWITTSDEIAAAEAKYDDLLRRSEVDLPDQARGISATLASHVSLATAARRGGSTMTVDGLLRCR